MTSRMYRRSPRFPLFQGRWRQLLFFVCFTSLSLTQMHCSCGTTPEETKPAKVSISAPVNNTALNRSKDSNPQLPGMQYTISVALENAVAGSQVTLTTNGKNPVTLDTGDAASLSFKDYTLEEGNNSLVAALKAPSGDVVRSASVLVIVDSQCYQIRIQSPSNNAILGPKDNTSKDPSVFQTSVKVQLDEAASEDVTLIVLDESSKEVSKTTRTPFKGEALFEGVALKPGKYTLKANIADAAGNACGDEIKVEVRFSTLQVTITNPTEGQLLCPKDDVNPNKNGFQYKVNATTSVEDGSTATLNLNGKDQAETKKVTGGQVDFDIDLPTLQAESTHKLKVTVIDELNNKGESKERNFRVRVRGEDITFLGLINGQTINNARDEDPNTPGIQLTVLVRTSAPDGTDINLVFNGQSQTTQAKAANASFSVTLKDGENRMKASVLNKECNLTTETPEFLINAQTVGAPAIQCQLEKGPKFNTTNESSLNKTLDTDTQKAGVQNGLVCESDAEVGQDLELDFNGQTLSQKLTTGSNKLTTASFQGLDFKEGENTLVVKVTNKGGRQTTRTYKVALDTTPPGAIVDLKAVLTNNRGATAQLTWSAPSDNGNKDVAGYQIRWSADVKAIDEKNWDTVSGKLDLNQAKSVGSQESATINKLQTGKAYVFAVRALDVGKNLGPLSNQQNVLAKLKVQSINTAGLSGERYGYKTIPIGDIDKDGNQDLLVCNLDATIGGKARIGAAYIYYGQGSAATSFFGANPDITLQGEDAGNSFCHNAVPMGDLNGDGFSDFAISAIGAQSGKGRVYVFFGGSRGALKTGNALNQAKIVISGTTAGELFAWNIASIGVRGSSDINGDNKADLFVAAFNTTNTGTKSKGKVYVFLSRSTYPSTTLQLNPSNADQVYINDTEGTAGGGFGNAIVGADFNGDKYTDIALCNVTTNRVLVFFGTDPKQALSKTLNSSKANVQLTGDAGSVFGSALANVGDVNKDGTPDLLVGAYLATAQGLSRAGKAYLYSGKKLTNGAKLTAKDAALTYAGKNAVSSLGRQVSAAGDMNKDGYADFLIAEGRAADGNTLAKGAVYLFYGNDFSKMKQGKAFDVADSKWFGSGAEQQLGFDGLFGGVDITGDGFPDICAGETPATKQKKKGKLSLWY